MTDHQTEIMPVAFPVLVVGNIQSTEFRDSYAWLDSMGAKSVADVERACEVMQSGFEPVLIVVAQANPGQFSPAKIETLRRHAPLARIVGLLGSWMEGERRTGRPWHPTSRAYWHQWLPRHAKAWNDAGQWSWPITALDEDRVLRKCATRMPAMKLACVIYAKQRESASALMEIANHQGWTFSWTRHTDELVAQSVDAVLFDAIRGNNAEIEEMSRLQNHFAHIPIVVLVGFPRTQDHEAWMNAGASALISKPYQIDDLIGEINRVVVRSAPPSVVR